MEEVVVQQRKDGVLERYTVTFEEGVHPARPDKPSSASFQTRKKEESEREREKRTSKPQRSQPPQPIPNPPFPIHIPSPPLGGPTASAGEGTISRVLGRRRGRMRGRRGGGDVVAVELWVWDGTRRSEGVGSASRAGLRGTASLRPTGGRQVQ